MFVHSPEGVGVKGLWMMEKSMPNSAWAFFFEVRPVGRSCPARMGRLGNAEPGGASKINSRKGIS